MTSKAATVLFLASSAGASYLVLRASQAHAATASLKAPSGHLGSLVDVRPEDEIVPRAPLDEPVHPDLSQRINRSSQQSTVAERPVDLLTQARRHDPRVTLDELTAARLAMSERGRGSFTELAAIIDTELNRAARQGISLTRSLTHRGTYGRQNQHRPASTRQDPRLRHLLAARAVLSGRARGVARGAVQFFDPVAMNRLNKPYRAWVAGGRKGTPPAIIVSCDALGLLEAWSFDYGRQGGNRCPPDRSTTGRHTLAWVGQIPGVDATRLMLMEPMEPGKEHTRRYQAARAHLHATLPRS